MDPRTAETVADARWFPLRYDLGGDAIAFAWIPPEIHRALTFITDVRPTDDEIRLISRKTVGEVDPPSEGSLHAILHSGLGGSTLLSRALGQPGVVTTLKEPPILTDVIAFGLQASNEEVRDLLRLVAALLSRPFDPAEVLVCKMNSVGNGVTSKIAKMRPDMRILCLQTPLDHMLASLASKGIEGRLDARKLYIDLLNSRMACVELSEEQIPEYGDLQLAALAWLSIQKMIGDAAKRFGPERVRSIGSEQLLGHTRESLSAIVDHFQLALDVEARLASGIYERHAKTGEPFDARKRAKALAESIDIHQAEIGPIMDWARKIAAEEGIAWELPYPLLI